MTQLDMDWAIMDKKWFLHSFHDNSMLSDNTESQLNWLTNSHVTIYSVLVGNSGELFWDVVYMLDFKFPKPPLEMDFICLQPKPQKPSDQKSCGFGKNTLQNFLSNMCIEAGIQEKKTNHNLCATGATAVDVFGDNDQRCS